MLILDKAKAPGDVLMHKLRQRLALEPQAPCRWPIARMENRDDGDLTRGHPVKCAHCSMCGKHTTRCCITSYRDYCVLGRWLGW